MSVTVPAHNALPKQASPARAAFYREAAVAFEIMALWHATTDAGRRAIEEGLQAAAALQAEQEARNK